jgi:hypothetical protein
LSERLTIHQRYVDQFIQAGHEPCHDYSQQGRLEATNLYYAAAPTRKQIRAMGLASLSTFLIFLALAAILWGVFYTGFDQFRLIPQ